MTERDTHFQNAAHFLVQEMDKRRFIADDTSLQHDEMQTLIVQFDYDLVYHTLANTTQAMAAENEHRPAIAENMRYIPDLTQWPESQEPE